MDDSVWGRGFSMLAAVRRGRVSVKERRGGEASSMLYNGGSSKG